MTVYRSALGLVVVMLASCGRPPAAAPAVASAPRPESGVEAAPALLGRVLDETGRPLPAAHVELEGADGKPLTRHQIAPDGSFEVPLSASSRRVARVRVVGAGHRTETLLVAAEDRRVEVTVKLGTLPARSEIEPAVVVFAGGSARPQAMLRQPDGSFSLDVRAPDGEHAYGILGVIANGLVGGTPTERYALGDHGDYRPQLTVKDGKARVVFDPRKRPAAAASTFEFAESDAASASLTAIQSRVAQVDEKSDELFDRLFKAKGGPVPDAGERISSALAVEWGAMRRDLATRAKTARRAVVRQAALVAYFCGEPPKPPTDDDEGLARRALEEVAPEDTLWSFRSAFLNALHVAGPLPKSAEYRAAFIARQPDPAAVAAVLLDELQAAKDDARRRELVAELQTSRYAGTMAQSRASAYDPDRKLAPGKDVAFDVQALTGKGRLTPKSFTGKVFLVELWGTWCAPCIAELPKLHALHAKYGRDRRTPGRSKGFTIMSIALESSADGVEKFRQDTAHPMPWTHGIADPETFQEEFAGPGMGVPFYVLVDDKGKIVASSPELHLADLPAILDRLLDE